MKASCVHQHLELIIFLGELSWNLRLKNGECAVGGCLLNAPAPLIIKENAFHTKCVTWLGLWALMLLLLVQSCSSPIATLS